MAKIGLFYGSNEGHTEAVAERIRDAFDAVEPGLVDVFNIGRSTVEDIARWDRLIFGIPTWNIGQLQDDWDLFLPRMDQLDLTGKTVAIFGLGDQYGYSGTFLDAVGLLADKVMDQGGEVVGLWPATGYEFEASLALVNDYFLGLAIDEDTQPRQTGERVRAWVAQLMDEFGLLAAEARPEASAGG